MPKANIEDVRRALRIAHQYRSTLTRYDRYRILMRAGEIIAQRKEEIATLITLESGLSLKDTLYEVGRASDVLLFDRQPGARGRRPVFRAISRPMQEPQGLYAQGTAAGCHLGHHAIQSPAQPGDPQGGAVVATNNRMVLKPSEKTPLAAFALADILYEAGLPPQMLSVVTGDPREIADELLTSQYVDLVTFTGGVSIGKYIAAKAPTSARYWSWAATIRSS